MQIHVFQLCRKFEQEIDFKCKMAHFGGFKCIFDKNTKNQPVVKHDLGMTKCQISSFGSEARKNFKELIEN